MHMSGPDEHKDSNNAYLKYRPKTQRYQQSTDPQFPIITELDETYEGHLLKQTDETVSEQNPLSQGRSRQLNSAAHRGEASQRQVVPSSAESKQEDHHKEVKNYVDSIIDDGMDTAGPPATEKNLINALSDSDDDEDAVNLQQQFDDCEQKNADDYINPLNKTRNANLPVAVKQAYNISNHFGSTNEIITNGDNDQVLITLNHRHTNSGQQTGRSSVARRVSQPSSRTNSKPHSKPLSRKLSLTEVSQAPPPLIT